MIMTNDYVEIVDKTITTTVGVTDLIEQYKQPFDAEFWSKYKALEQMLGDKFSQVVHEVMSKRKITDELLRRAQVNREDLRAAQLVILDEWAKNKKEAKERGTLLHAQLEGTAVCDEFESEGISNLEIVPDHDIVCGRNAQYRELPLSYYDAENKFLLKGTADFVAINDGTLFIADYKTGSKINKNSHFDKENKQFQMMRYPVMNVKDSNFYHYSLQLSFYAWMIMQKNPELNLKQLVIIHYDNDMKKRVIPAEYMPHEVELLIKDYIKKQKVKRINDKYKPFEY